MVSFITSNHARLCALLSLCLFLPAFTAGCAQSQSLTGKKSSNDITVLVCQVTALGTTIPKALIKNHKQIDIVSPMWFVANDRGKIAARNKNCKGPYNTYVSTAHKYNIQVLPILCSFSPGKLLGNPKALNDCAVSAVKLAGSNRFDGFLIDFEHLQAVDRKPMVGFMKHLQKLMHQHNLTLGIAVASHSWHGAWDYKNLGKYSDYLYVMFYDYTGPWSKIVGATSPLRWPNQSRDIQRDLTTILSLNIPSRKILFGIPFYGNDFTLKADNHNKHTSVKTMYISQIIKLKRGYNATEHWDKNSATPYFEYSDKKGHLHQVWYDNIRSFTAKLNMVRKYHLGGVGIWSMRYAQKPGCTSFWKALKSSADKTP